MPHCFHLVVSAFLLVATTAAAWAEERLPIFDAHVHFSQPAWAAHPPQAVMAAFEATGVPRALVSSTPDDGTLMLRQIDPSRVVPFLQPYRDGVTSANWFNDPNLIAYLEERLKTGDYRGVGEVHFFSEQSVASPQVKRLVALIVERDLMFHVHSGAVPIRALFALEPRLKILWAHAGMSEPPSVVGSLLESQSQLWAELSFRADDIAPGGRLDDDWRALFLRHTDRFMVGSDTYVTARWDSYGALVEDHRAWLRQLPRGPAEAIAYRNAVRLFGDGGHRELQAKP